MGIFLSTQPESEVSETPVRVAGMFRLKRMPPPGSDDAEFCVLTDSFSTFSESD